MITEQEKNSLLENLRQIPILELACKKSGVARASFYRLKKEDKEFSKLVDDAILDGEDLINDLSQSQLVSSIRDGNFQAIQLWLKHHHKKYADKVEVSGSIDVKDKPLTDEQKQLVEKSLMQAGILLNGDNKNGQKSEQPQQSFTGGNTENAGAAAK
jgi:hypothetical protein